MLKHVASICLVLLVLLGCNSLQPANSQPESTASSVDKNTVGAISGTISLSGTAPKFPPLDMSADPGCPSAPQPEDIFAGQNGKLANVLIYIKDGLPSGYYPRSSDPVVIDQKGCRYEPHVVAVSVNQPVKILNNDNAEHNIHPMPRNNPPWNVSQMPRGDAIVKTFAHPEIMMPVECNQHPWMKMYVSVMEHPYFAVSSSDGSFTIKDVPPGDYTLAAVHEKIGEQTMKIKVGPKENARVDFSFTAPKK